MYVSVVNNRGSLHVFQHLKLIDAIRKIKAVLKDFQGRSDEVVQVYELLEDAVTSETPRLICTDSEIFGGPIGDVANRIRIIGSSDPEAWYNRPGQVFDVHDISERGDAYWVMVDVDDDRQMQYLIPKSDCEAIDPPAKRKMPNVHHDPLYQLSDLYWMLQAWYESHADDFSPMVLERNRTFWSAVDTIAAKGVGWKGLAAIAMQTYIDVLRNVAEQWIAQEYEWDVELDEDKWTWDEPTTHIKNVHPDADGNVCARARFSMGYERYGKFAKVTIDYDVRYDQMYKRETLEEVLKSTRKQTMNSMEATLRDNVLQLNGSQ